jgi:DNA-directed RNA polymerase subunit M/transcription elongation factor TFIIS
VICPNCKTVMTLFKKGETVLEKGMFTLEADEDIFICSKCDHFQENNRELTVSIKNN